MLFPKAREEFEKRWKSLEEKLKKKGVSEGLIRRAKEYAEEYIEGYTDKYFAEALPSFKEKAQIYIVDDALEMAQKWLTGLLAIFAPRKAEKLLEAVSL